MPTPNVKQFVYKSKGAKRKLKPQYVRGKARYLRFLVNL